MQCSGRENVGLGESKERVKVDIDRVNVDRDRVNVDKDRENAQCTFKAVN